MTQTELRTFLLKLDALCSQYNIFVVERKEWRERPSATHFFYDVQVRAKVDGQQPAVSDIYESAPRRC